MNASSYNKQSAAEFCKQSEEETHMIGTILFQPLQLLLATQSRVPTW